MICSSFSASARRAGAEVSVPLSKFGKLVVNNAVETRRSGAYQVQVVGRPGALANADSLRNCIGTTSDQGVAQGAASLVTSAGS